MNVNNEVGRLEGFKRAVFGFCVGRIANPFGTKGEYYGCDGEDSMVDPPPLQTS